jgi:hypothetical protein
LVFRLAAKFKEQLERKDCDGRDADLSGLDFNGSLAGEVTGFKVSVIRRGMF